MSTTVSSKAYRRGDADILPPHIVALIRERQRRLAAISRYDRYIAQAAGHLTLQGFWRNLKRQDMEDAQRLKNWLDREIADGGARSQGIVMASPLIDQRRETRDASGDVTSLQGFAWHVRKRPGSETSGPGRHPFDGLDSKYQPLCWPIGPQGFGVRNRGPGPAFLVIIPTLNFGPPEVGGSWEVEPAELDDFWTEDGRIRLVAMEWHRSHWGTVAECEFEVESRRRGTRDPGSGPVGPRVGVGRVRAQGCIAIQGETEDAPLSDEAGPCGWNQISPHP